MAITPNLARLKRLIITLSEIEANGLKIGGHVAIDTSGTSMPSGSSMTLRGTGESIFFHMGGNQYISSNSYYDAGNTNKWYFESTGSAALRLGFFQNNRSLVFSVDNTGEIGLPERVAFKERFVLSGSDGQVGIGADTATYGADTAIGLRTPNAQFQVCTPNLSRLAVSVTGSTNLDGDPNGNSYFKMPTVNTTGSIAVPSNGMMVYDNTADTIRVYVNGAWATLNTN